MNTNQQALLRLQDPFDESDLEWMPKTFFERDGVVKALALCYVTSRAIQQRLDETLGPQNWRDEYREGPQGGVLCGLSIRCSLIADMQDNTYVSEWVTKWDGAENTDIEPVKGGISNAFKRAAVKWGIGRYLYDAPNIWVRVEATQHNGKWRFKKWLDKPTLNAPAPRRDVERSNANQQPQTNGKPVAFSTDNHVDEETTRQALNVQFVSLVRESYTGKADEWPDLIRDFKDVSAQRFEGGFESIPLGTLNEMVNRLQKMDEQALGNLVAEKVYEYRSAIQADQAQPLPPPAEPRGDEFTDEDIPF